MSKFTNFKYKYEDIDMRAAHAALPPTECEQKINFWARLGYRYKGYIPFYTLSGQLHQIKLIFEIED